MGLHPSLQAANDLWDNLLEVDENNDNKIEFSEFKQFVLYRDEELWKIFTQIDEDESGYLSIDEITNAEAVHIDIWRDLESVVFIYAPCRAYF